MGSCSSKQREHEFTLLKDRVTELDKLQETVGKLEEKLQIHESYAMSYFKKHDAIEKSVKLHQAHARGYYAEHDQLVQSYKADKAAEPVYKMLETEWCGEVVVQYGRCYKFNVGETVNIHFAYNPSCPGNACTFGKLEAFYVLPDGLTYDRGTATISGVVTIKQESKIYVGRGPGNMAEQIISIEIV